MTTFVWMEPKYSQGRLTALAVALASGEEPFGATVILNQDFGPNGPAPGTDAQIAAMLPEKGCLAGFDAGWQHSMLSVALPKTQARLHKMSMDIYSVAFFAISHGMTPPNQDTTDKSVGAGLTRAVLMGKQISDFFLTKTLH